MKLLVVYLLCVIFGRNNGTLNGVWRWECTEGFCQKAAITPETETTAQSLPECRLFCSPFAALWPKPKTLHVGITLAQVNINRIGFDGVDSESPYAPLAEAAFKRFLLQITNLLPPDNNKINTGGQSLVISYAVTNPAVTRLTLDTDESYSLKIIEMSDGSLKAHIAANNNFGARHGLETLSQLIIYDDLRNQIMVSKNVDITDYPSYPYRGILLDTSRNYINVNAIKRTLEAMAMSKLNSFHWHITDSHSFPYVSENLPDLAKYGSYSSRKIYSPQDVADIVQYGLERGIRIVPEFDAPAHVGEGWQTTDFVTCFNAKPWQDYCVEPPCGQFDPTKDELYNTLEALYGDMLKQFQPDIFHMGGDEVHFGCWNSTQNIVQWMQNQGWGRSEADFVKLWDHFQKKALARLYNKAGTQIPVVLWTSTLTQTENLQYLPKDQYIIQIWTLGNDSQVTNLLNSGYKVILSNHDALYFDCGFSGWVTDGNNWCSPYVGWQKVYGNTPEKISGDKKGQVLGSEAALWTEQVDSASVDTRLWPRAAAMGEVLWSEPKEGTWRDAEARILVHRERLVQNGINSDALEPEWCWQHEENCPIDGTTTTTTPTVPTGGSSSRLNEIKFIVIICILKCVLI